MSKMTEKLIANDTGIARAVQVLRMGGLVAFPTETVYGLGADARNGQAVAAIYEAKGRPSFNPLIVHVASCEAAFDLGVFPKSAHDMVADDWPEGLSLVVPIDVSAGVSPLVTAGKPTVALRVPAAPIARRFLSEFGGPVAAPSANVSGRISPTSALHVLSGLDGVIDAVLDGGETSAGLESTIIGFSDGVPVVYREGVYQVPDSMVRVTAAKGDAVNAPGQLASHYAPKGQVRLNAPYADAGEWHLGFGAVAGDVTLSATGDLREAAANLFALLHQADVLGKVSIAVAPIPDQGLGRAINDRLRRAAAPR